MSAIVRKLSSSTYPGFEDFKAYFLSCAKEFWAFKSNDDVTKTSSAIVFGDTGGSGLNDMLWIMDQPEFRTLHNLLPAGTTESPRV